MIENPFDWPAVPFLTLYAFMALALFGLGLWMRQTMGGSVYRPTRLNELEWAYLAKGAGRLTDVALLCLAAKGCAVVANKSWTITASDAAPLEALTGGAIPLPLGQAISRTEFQKAMAPGVARIRQGLQARGLCPTDEEMNVLRLSFLPFVGVLLAFGAVKLVVGASRHHPVGILAFCLITTVVGAVFLMRTQTQTRAGRKALTAHRFAQARAARAPLDHELAMAVALSGAVVLSGTAYASIYQASKASGGDGGGGDGGGCGGGGCGGCS